eukprot:9559117-Lingulodinium_polyedra.AAC.1
MAFDRNLGDPGEGHGARGGGLVLAERSHRLRAKEGRLARRAKAAAKEARAAAAAAQRARD